MNRKSYLFECEVNELLANPKKGVQRIYYHTIEGNEIEEGGLSCPGMVHRPLEKALSTSARDLSVKTSLPARSLLRAMHQIQNPSCAEALFKPMMMAINFQSPDR